MCCCCPLQVQVGHYSSGPLPFQWHSQRESGPLWATLGAGAAGRPGAVPPQHCGQQNGWELFTKVCLTQWFNREQKNCSVLSFLLQRCVCLAPLTPPFSIPVCSHDCLLQLQNVLTYLHWENGSWVNTLDDRKYFFVPQNKSKDPLTNGWQTYFDNWWLCFRT